MQIDELPTVLKRLGWSKAELARRVHLHPDTVSRWRKIPGPVVAYLDLVEQVRSTADNLKRII